MRTLGILSFLTAVALGLHVGGVVNFDPAVTRVVQVAQNIELIDKDSFYTIIGLDITDGREKELEKDRKAISERIGSLGSGDRLAVYLIHSKAESEQEAVLSVDMPENPGPAGQVLLRAKKEAEESWAACWKKSVLPLVKSDKTQRTDLFGFMRFIAAKTEFMKHRNSTLILFTDGQQVGDGFNMEKKAPSHVELEKAAQKDLLPNLRGIRLMFVGVTPTHGIDNAHWRKIQTFWQDYGKKTETKSTNVSSERIINLK